MLLPFFGKIANIELVGQIDTIVNAC